MAIVTPTDSPKSVRNHCVIEVFVGVFVLSHWFLDFSVGEGAFVLGLSQISSFFLLPLFRIQISGFKEEEIRRLVAIFVFRSV